MNRRAFLRSLAGAGVLTATDGLSTPAISQRAAARVLRFVPQADLANFDPIQNTQYVVRNAAALVWDMLYGFDDRLSHGARWSRARMSRQTDSFGRSVCDRGSSFMMASPCSRRTSWRAWRDGKRATTWA